MSVFPVLSVDTADERIRPTLRQIQGDAEVLPAAVARIANSPENLRGFLAAHAQFERSSLDPAERELVTLVVAFANGCRVCIGMHSPILDGLVADDGATTLALSHGHTVADDRHEALRRFTLAVLQSRGDVGDEELTRFLAAGFTGPNALDVVLGVGTYTISTFTNRLIESNS